MKKKTTFKNLTLNKETIASLDVERLKNVKGGTVVAESGFICDPVSTSSPTYCNNC
ncbi:MAG: hypothetical protein GY940_22105 [bacterium]|nr:hypothetical protein [bacterium]